MLIKVKNGTRSPSNSINLATRKSWLSGAISEQQQCIKHAEKLRMQAIDKLATKASQEILKDIIQSKQFTKK